MKSRQLFLAAGAACAILASGCAGPADSVDAALAVTGPSLANGPLGPPLTGGGTAQILSLVITSVEAAGPNVKQERTITGVLDGTLQGTFVEQARGIIHQTGLVTYQATFTFTGTVAGCTGSGTFTATLSGRGQAGLPVTDANFRVVDQSSNTLRIAGTGTMRQVGPTATYDVRYVCS